MGLPSSVENCQSGRVRIGAQVSLRVFRTIVKKKPFADSKYCRFGDMFKDKYLNDNPVYDMNALSTSGDYHWRDLEWVRRDSANESSLIK